MPSFSSSADKQLLASYTEAKLAVGQQKQQLEAELEKLGILKETAEFNMDSAGALPLPFSCVPLLQSSCALPP